MAKLTLTGAAKWLSLVYAAFVLAVMLWNADAADVVVLSVLLLPWITGPAVIAALVARSIAADGSAWAWAFFILEVLVVASTIVVWTYLWFVAPDAQNGVAMMLFPVVQYGAIVAVFLVAAVTDVVRRERGLRSEI